MATASGPTSERVSWSSRILSTGLGLLVVALVLMWAIEVVDTVILDDELQTNGIAPRQLEGLDGIVWAPFLHSTFAHLISNSIPFLALGFLVSIRGYRYWILVTLMVMVGGGALTWLFGGSGNHIGASGVVFGYFGALMGAAFYDRRPRAIAPALIAILFYSGIVVGMVPRQGISWEGHLFGLVIGVLAARALVRSARPLTPRGSSDGSKPYPWELDEPWLEP
ncbi:MAG: rhomboid family intramembrane serine protease [Actinomycetia bacterium]|nr:rhomboid family intramembrane serine protease [Actinomycetes bacterium]